MSGGTAAGLEPADFAIRRKVRAAPGAAEALLARAEAAAAGHAAASRAALHGAIEAAERLCADARKEAPRELAHLAREMADHAELLGLSGIAAIGAALCALAADGRFRAAAGTDIARLHVQAARALLRAGAQQSDDATARALIEGLRLAARRLG